MKQLLLISVIALFSAFGASGKSNVENLFASKISKKPNVTQVVINGAQLEEYNLDQFLSLTVKDNIDRETVLNAVETDSKNARNKELTYSKGKIALGFISLQPERKKNRYIFYLSNDNKSVVIFMRGVASLSDIKKLIKKNN